MDKINKRVEEEKDTKMRCRSLFMLLLIVDLIALFSVSSMNSVKGVQDFTVNHILHEDESYVWVMGEVINNRDKPARNVSVAITFLFSNLPTTTKNYSTIALLDVIMPGRRSPFAVHIDKQEVQGYSECMVEIQHYEDSEPKPFGLSIMDIYLILDSNSCVCSGTIAFNGTGVGPKHLAAMACVYNDKGLFDVGTETIDLNSNMSYGDTADFGFRALFTNKSSNITSFTVTTESISHLNDPGYAAYAEVTSLKASNEPSQTIDYRLLLPVSAIIAVVIITIISVRKQKAGHVKKRGSTKRMHVLHPLARAQ